MKRLKMHCYHGGGVNARLGGEMGMAFARAGDGGGGGVCDGVTAEHPVGLWKLMNGGRGLAGADHDCARGFACVGGQQGASGGLAPPFCEMTFVCFAPAVGLERCWWPKGSVRPRPRTREARGG